MIKKSGIDRVDIYGIKDITHAKNPNIIIISTNGIIIRFVNTTYGENTLNTRIVYGSVTIATDIVTHIDEIILFAIFINRFFFAYLILRIPTSVGCRSTIPITLEKVSKNPKFPAMNGLEAVIINDASPIEVKLSIRLRDILPISTIDVMIALLTTEGEAPANIVNPKRKAIAPIDATFFLCVINIKIE